MTKKLKLAKNDKKRANASLRLQSAPPVTNHDDLSPETTLTAAEASEAARFKALTTAKAIRQARIRRMMDELETLESIHPAA